jgi:16S rRNA (cytidine1402-2'-O)-methyltransferase
MNDQAGHNAGNCGTLYVVSTPIGNLEDITLRALTVLRSVDLIAAEKVSHTRGLCRHYGIETRLTSYHQHNRKVKALELVEKLKAGRNIAIVTDAGTPGISDPGVYLINRAVREEIKVVPIPGPSAVIAGLSVSGLPAEEFVFLGFLPNRSGKRKSELRRLASESRTMVFFEAPHRVKAMLADLREILGDREIVMLRELTKVFEEVKRGPASTILQHLPSERIRGEFTLVMAGRDEKKKVQALSKGVLRRIEGHLAEKKMSIKDIAHLVSSEEGLAYRQIYKECLARKKALGV